MLDLPGFSGVPISVSRYLPDGVELTIRAADRRRVSSPGCTPVRSSACAVRSVAAGRWMRPAVATC